MPERKPKDPSARRFLAALADKLDRMTAKDLVRFIAALRRCVRRGRGRRS